MSINSVYFSSPHLCISFITLLVFTRLNAIYVHKEQQFGCCLLSCSPNHSATSITFPAAGTDCTCCHGNGLFLRTKTGQNLFFSCFFHCECSRRAKNNAICHRVVKDTQLSSRRFYNACMRLNLKKEAYFCILNKCNL